MPVGQPAGIRCRPCCATARDPSSHSAADGRSVMGGIDGPAPGYRQSRALGDRARRLVPRVLDLAHAHGQAPLIERGDRLWDSSNVPHATRWQLDLPDRAGTFGYMADVLARQEEQLGGSVDDEARYFYELAIRHEDMHVEALTYSRQTLSYAPPHELGDVRRPAAGPLPGDVDVPGGTWRLGSTAADGFIFDNEKWAHETPLAPFRIARAAVTNAEFAAFVEGGGYGAREFWSDAGWAWRQRHNAERPVYWLPKRDGVWTVRRYRAPEELSPHAARRVRQLVRGGSVVPLGRPPPAKRSRMGSSRHRRASAGRHAIGRCAPALAVGRCNLPRPTEPISTMPSTGRSMSQPAPTATAPSAAGR